MRKVFLIIIYTVIFILPALSMENSTQADFSKMEKLWCTVDYRHWATNYPDMLNYTEVDFYLYLDEKNKLVYDENKNPMAQTISFEDKEIKFLHKYHEGKKEHTEQFSIDRYTGRIKGEGKIRHDWGAWASLTYENRDFDAKGQCALVSDERKF